MRGCSCLALAEDQEQPLLERVNFAGIMGMIDDEFAMKRIGGLFRRVRRGGDGRGPEGLTPEGELAACRAELRSQQQLVARVVEEQLRPALRGLGTPILNVEDLTQSQRDYLARWAEWGRSAARRSSGAGRSLGVQDEPAGRRKSWASAKNSGASYR